MKKRTMIAVALMLTLAFVLAACAPAAAPPAADPVAPPPVEQPQAPPTPPAPPEVGELPALAEETARTHLNVVLMQMPVSLHPTGSNDAYSSLVNSHIYNTLIYLDRENNALIPALATSWEFIDLSTVNFQLREGVTFHNGQPFTARDVQYSLESAAVAPQAALVLGMVDSVTVNDDFNVTVHLEMPFAPILLHLTHSLASIAPYGATLEEMEAHPIGTGPFMYGGLVIGDRVELIRNDNYWGDMPLIETITIRLIPESSGRLLAVETGEADIALDIEAPDVGPAEAFANVDLRRIAGLRTTYIAFNTQKPPFDNILVRQAINYAIPLEPIIDAVFMGVSVPAVGPLAPGVFGWTDLPPSEFNPERARELMIEAGHADGFDAYIWYNIPDQARRDISEILQNLLREININLTVVGLELADYLDRARAGEHDMMILGWTTVTGDADYGLFPMFHTESIGINNYSFWGTPELDDLLERGRTETDVAVRLEIYRQAQQIIQDAMPWIFMYHDEWLVATSLDLRGFNVNPARNHNFARVWFD